jgi:DNA (cytosine-5)-methyltransferase 1
MNKETRAKWKVVCKKCDTVITKYDKQNKHHKYKQNMRYCPYCGNKVTHESWDKMKVVSLFSGCGGLDLGFVQAGFNIVWSNDLFPEACETYSENKHYFDALKYENPTEGYSGKHRIFCGNIEDIKSFRTAVGDNNIDVIIGGFPCQDFSVLRGSEKRGRGGIKVKRGRLYCHFIRALAELQPKMFIAENVKGLKTANKGLAYKSIIHDFEHLKDSWGIIKNSKSMGKKQMIGYKLLFKDVINFSAFGVPQNRERLIIIGLRKDLIKKLEKSNFNVNKYNSHLKKKFLHEGYDYFSRYPLTPLEALTGKSLNELQEKYISIMKPFEKKIKEIDSKRKQEYVDSVWKQLKMDIWDDYLFLISKGNGLKKKQSTLFSAGEFKEKTTISESHKDILKEMNYYNRPLKLDNINLLREADNVKLRMEHIPPGENHEFVRDTEYHVSGLMSNIYKRLHPLKPSPTIIANGGGGTWGYHYEIDRQRLTNRERARLQTFPDDFIFKGTPSKIRTQIGNAVPPLASYRIASKIKKDILELVS